MIDPEVREAARLGASGYSLSLERVVRTINVWADCSYPLLRAEGAVIASPPFQRLRRLRQMGLAFHAWANAENTRASHSLGVAYWSSQYLAALRRVPDATTQAGLAWADASVDGLSFGVVLRLFALLHDIDLLPLGPHASVPVRVVRRAAGAAAAAAPASPPSRRMWGTHSTRGRPPPN